MKEEKPLSEKRKEIFKSWLRLSDVRIKAFNPETLDILFNAIEKQDAEAVKKLKEEIEIKHFSKWQKKVLNNKIDKIMGSFNHSPQDTSAKVFIGSSEPKTKQTSPEDTHSPQVNKKDSEMGNSRSSNPEDTHAQEKEDET